MSNPNLFNGDLAQTNLENAYHFTSFSPYIINGGLNSRFSPNCIFCSSNNTINLINDGSFKQCNNCKKQFKAVLLNNQANNQLNNFRPYRYN
jgi:hypothetical protein